MLVGQPPFWQQALLCLDAGSKHEAINPDSLSAAEAAFAGLPHVHMHACAQDCLACGASQMLCSEPSRRLDGCVNSVQYVTLGKWLCRAVWGPMSSTQSAEGRARSQRRSTS